jgi:AraC family transcriptional regulator of adaptative response / DNA-3-methyladenine glycosylase II
MRLPDSEACYRAVSSRDARFDGWFYVGVTSTGIYCRPSCPARTPKISNVRFYPTSAAAQELGFRACKRCRPDSTPGSPQWNMRGDLTARALRLIADGVIDRDGVSGLAQRVGYSSRQLGRALIAEVGAGPIALARAQRAHAARTLLETTDLPITDVAFAAGFASVRQFNDTVRAVYDANPSQLRQKVHGALRSTRVGPGAALSLRLPFREPMDLAHTLEFLGARAIDGVEASENGSFTRAVGLPHGPALFTVSPAPGTRHVHCELRLTDQRDLTAAVGRIRRLLDLDADPVAIIETLSKATALTDLVHARPGLRSPGAVDGFELAVRAIAGQLVSLASARRSLTRIAYVYGERVGFNGRTWTIFPTAVTIAGIDPSTLPVRRAQGAAIVAVAQAIDRGDLDLGPGADRDEAERKLVAIKGIGPWTARYVRMRALSDPDVLLTGDLVIDRALGTHLDPAAIDAPCAPWRSYVTHHLWAAAATPLTGTGSP